jgi:TonB family protein
VHALLAVIAHPPHPTHSQEERLSERIALVRISRATPPPTPRPSPRPTPAIAVPHVVSAIPSPHAPAARPSPVAAASARSRPRPAASPATPPPSACPAADASAAVVAAASPPPIPPGVRAQNVSAVAAVSVSLDANGNVTGAQIAQSTQSPSFDALALEMARDTQYAPARRDCKAIASTYLFRVQFSAW